MQSGDALEEGIWILQSTQHSDEPQRCLLSQNSELGKRAGNWSVHSGGSWCCEHREGIR